MLAFHRGDLAGTNRPGAAARDRRCKPISIAYTCPMSRPSLQNRVDPFGELHAVSSRGSLMGNRGILHDDQQRIRRQWSHKSWVTCALAYGNVKRAVFAPNNYSELFFLDEATSLAAGHRPCNTCQRQRYVEFKRAWIKANMADQGQIFVAAPQLDSVMHMERAIPGGGKRTFDAFVSELPLGTMFEHEGNAYLVWVRGILRWSFDGYARAPSTMPSHPVRVLTPASIVRMYRVGFVPRAHSSAESELQQEP